MGDDTGFGAILGLLDPSAPPEAHRALREAYLWARELYGDQRRQDSYSVLTHACSVAADVSRFGHRDPEMLASALLHDVLEVTHASPTEIERRFGPRVLRLVEALTHGPGEPTAVSAQRALEAGEDAVLLRLCDRLDGLRRSRLRSPLSRSRFLAATHETYIPLAEQHFPALATTMRQALREVEQTLE